MISGQISVSLAPLLRSPLWCERDARSPALHSRRGWPDDAKARAEHLAFVRMQRLPQRHALACDGDQTVRELAGVAKRAVGPRAVGWHDMNRITQQGDGAGLPGLEGDGLA